MTQLIHELRTSGGDYSNPSNYCSHLAGTDLVNSQVFFHNGIAGSLLHGQSVTGSLSGATADIVFNPTSTQILLENIVGTFQAGDVCQVSPGNSVTLDDSGSDCDPSLRSYPGLYNDRFYVLNAVIRSASTIVTC